MTPRSPQASPPWQRQIVSLAVLVWGVAAPLILACSRDEVLDPSQEADAAALNLGATPGAERVERNPRQVLVRLAPGASIGTINQRYGTWVLERLETEPSFLLRVPAGSTVGDLLPAMTEDPALEVAEPNYQLGNPEAQGRSSMTFADPSLKQADYTDQTALERIRAPQAQAIARGQGVIVAVLDTGVQLDHPRLARRIAPGGIDLVDDDADPSDTPDGVDTDGDGLIDEAVGHGTFVAGLVLSVAPRASILPVRVLDSDGFGTAFDLARGIEAAKRSGARVINMSLGMGVPSGIVDGLIERFKGQDVFFVASAGNQDAEQPQQFPARDSYVAGTAALDTLDRKTDFSNFGSWVDVSAPGEGLISYFPPSALATWSGTSFSSGLVSGAAALAISARPSARFNDVRDAILDTAVDIDDRNPNFRGELGEGRIDVLAAARAIQED